MQNKPPEPPAVLIPSTQSDQSSAEQITALVSSLMDGLKPIAQHQAEVQLRQIAANEEQHKRHFDFARAQLRANTIVIIVVLMLLALAAGVLFLRGNDAAGVQIITFALGALGGYGVGKSGKDRN